MKALYDPNLLVFALKGMPREVSWKDLFDKAKSLERRYGLPFRKYLSRLRGMNRCTREALVVG